MNTRAAGLLVALGACLTLPAVPASAQENTALEVQVGTGAPRRLGAAELAALPQADIVETRKVGSGDTKQSEEVRWRGVLLRDVLDAAGMQSLDRYALRRSAVVARATDNYAALFSWGELFNARMGENVLVVTAMNGRPLPASEGPYALRSLSDTKSGPRHVKWLRRLEVLTVAK